MIRVSYMDQEVTLYLNDTIMLSLAVMSGVWKFIALTLNFMSGEMSLLTSSDSNSTEISSNDFIEQFSGVNIGTGFSGLLQDIRVYDSPLQELNLPSQETFLPQCYCRSNSSQCSADNKRYLQLVYYYT